MVNSLSRLTREALAIKKYTDARSRAALRKLDVHRKFGESENRAIVRKVDEVFGLASISDPPADEFSETRRAQDGSGGAGATSAKSEQIRISVLGIRPSFGVFGLRPSDFLPSARN